MSQDSQIARFDVGGQRFATTRMTLSRYPESKLSCASSGEIDARIEGILKLSDGTIFIDRDPALFSIVLSFLRSGRLQLPEGFRDASRLREEAVFYEINSLVELLAPTTETVGGYITLGYRGTFAFGRDGQADVKFRKLQRILVHGKAALCREVFGESLNESRDPGDHDGMERYTGRLYLKHQCLEKACDNMAEKGFKLVATCTSGANGLAAINHPLSATLSSNNQNANRMSRFKRGHEDTANEELIMNHRNSGDHEEQRWAHYTEYVFYREPVASGQPVAGPANNYA